MLVINDDSVLQSRYINYYWYRITKHNVIRFLEEAKKQGINLKDARELERRLLCVEDVIVMLRKQIRNNEIILDYLPINRGYTPHEYKPHKLIKYNKPYLESN